MKEPTIDFQIEDTRYGFVYGPVTIERCCDDKKAGVFIWMGTKREQMIIRVTPGGRISVYNHEKNTR